MSVLFFRSVGILKPFLVHFYIGIYFKGGSLSIFIEALLQPPPVFVLNFSLIAGWWLRWWPLLGGLRLSLCFLSFLCWSLLSNHCEVANGVGQEKLLRTFVPLWNRKQEQFSYGERKGFYQEWLRVIGKKNTKNNRSHRLPFFSLFFLMNGKMRNRKYSFRFLWKMLRMNESQGNFSLVSEWKIERGFCFNYFVECSSLLYSYILLSIVLWGRCPVRALDKRSPCEGTGQNKIKYSFFLIYIIEFIP